MDPQLCRMLLLRRLHLPLPLTARHCRCGLPLDSRGHHRAACARVGVLGRRGYPLESVVAQICREAGGRVTTNVLVRDLDIAEGSDCGRWPETGGCRRWAASLRRRAAGCGHPRRKRRATSHHRGRSGPARSATAEGTEVSRTGWAPWLRPVSGVRG